MVRSSFADPAKLGKVIKTLIKWPDLKVPEAMILSRFSYKEVANLSLHCFIRQSLPGKTTKGLMVHMRGPLTPPPPQPDHTVQLCNRTINDAAVCVNKSSCTTDVGAC
jgi:hypothetical protein